MLRSSPVALWLSLTAAGWTGEGSTTVEGGLGYADYTYQATCSGHRRVIASPVYAHVKRVQPGGFTLVAEGSAAPGRIVDRGSDPEVSGPECGDECTGDFAFSGMVAGRIGYTGERFAGEIGIAGVAFPDWGVPLPSARLRYGNPELVWGEVDFVVGPFSGADAIDHGFGGGFQ